MTNSQEQLEVLTIVNSLVDRIDEILKCQEDTKEYVTKIKNRQKNDLQRMNYDFSAFVVLIAKECCISVRSVRNDDHSATAAPLRASRF